MVAVSPWASVHTTKGGASFCSSRRAGVFHTLMVGTCTTPAASVPSSARASPTLNGAGRVAGEVGAGVASGAGGVPSEIGNEMPEKPMHERIRDAIRECGYTGLVTVNRQDDSPGQYWNMGIDRGQYDAIAHHGFLDPDYLDDEHPGEAAAGRPTTFRAFWEHPDVIAARVIVSSDGGGGNPIHLPKLQEVACDVLRRGGSYEHQLALKRNRFYGDGALRMSDLAIDSEFLHAVRQCR